MAAPQNPLVTRVQELMATGMDVDAAIALAQREAQPKPIKTLPDLAGSIVSRLGLKPTPKVDQSTEITVRGQRGPAIFEQGRGLPAEGNTIPGKGTGLMQQITLGDETHPPTGVYMAPTDAPMGGPRGRNLTPNVQSAWDEVRNKHPFVSRYVSDAMMAPGVGEARYNTHTRSISIDPEAENLDRNVLLQYLAHELTHAGQQNNFPDTVKGNAQRMWNYETFGPVKYWQQLGEEQAYQTMFDVTAQQDQQAVKAAEAAAAARKGRKK